MTRMKYNNIIIQGKVSKLCHPKKKSSNLFHDTCKVVNYIMFPMNYIIFAQDTASSFSFCHTPSGPKYKT